MAIAVSDQSGWDELIVVPPMRLTRFRVRRPRWNGSTPSSRNATRTCSRGTTFSSSTCPTSPRGRSGTRSSSPWGRDGTLLTSRPSRVQIAEKTINYPKFECRGRHIIDTFLLLQLYDIGTRELESFGLKDAARHFGLTAGGDPNAAPRTYLEGKEHSGGPTLHDFEAFKSYALEDVRETRALADLLSRPYFIMAQIYPYNYQEVVVRGQATRINALFLREYYQRLHSLPDLPKSTTFEGGLHGYFRDRSGEATCGIATWRRCIRR